MRKLGMGLDEEAVAAVKKWRFRARHEGRPTESQFMINVEVNFRTGVSAARYSRHSPAQAKGAPAAVSRCADLTKYPLVVYDSDVAPLPNGNDDIRSGQPLRSTPASTIPRANALDCWSANRIETTAPCCGAAAHSRARWIVEKPATRAHRAEGN